MAPKIILAASFEDLLNRKQDLLPKTHTDTLKKVTKELSDDFFVGHKAATHQI